MKLKLVKPVVPKDFKLVAETPWSSFLSDLPAVLCTEGTEQVFMSVGIVEGEGS